MTKKIPLTQGKFALVDDEDYDYLNQWKWRFDGRYVVRTATISFKNRITIWMHRLIMGTSVNELCDHINHNTLDNQRLNLRNASTFQSAMNRRIHKNNKSGYKGVVKRGNSSWRATVDFRGKHVFCHTFPSAIAAAKAYDENALKWHGEFADLNFPD